MSTADNVIAALAAYDLKKHGNNRYRCRSPFHTNDGSPAFSLIIHDNEHGAWKDFITEEGGSLYDLAERLGVEIVQNGYKSPSTPEYTNLDDYARAHGVERKVFEDFFWSDTTRYGKPALAFKTRSGTRHRMLKGDNKFLNPTDFKACWYGLNELLRKKLDDLPLMVYVNGEPSVVVGQHFNVPAFTVAGGGEREIPSNLMNDLKGWLGDVKVEIIVALDCDVKGLKAAHQLVKQFQKEGFESRAVDLSLWDKGDLADYCKLHKENSVSVIYDLPLVTETNIEERQQHSRRWFIGDKSDLMKIPPVEWLLEPFIPKNMVGILFGQSNIGKSFIAIDFALRLAQEHCVMYMIAEGEQGYAQRVLAWEKHHRLSSQNMKYCFGAVHLMDEHDFNAFLSEMERIKPKLVLIDTVKKTLIGGDSNSGKDVAIYLDRCETIRKTIGCTVLLVHHTNKDGQKMTGNYSWTTDPDFVIQADDEDELIRLRSNKERASAKFQPHYRRMHLVEIEHFGEISTCPVIVEAERVIQTEEDPLKPSQVLVLEAMNMAIFRDGVSPSDLERYIDELSYRSIARALSALKQFGYISQRTKRSPYAITPKGVSVLMTIGHIGHIGHIGQTEFKKMSENPVSYVSELSVVSESDDLEAFGRENLGAEVRQLPLTDDDRTNTTLNNSHYGHGA